MSILSVSKTAVGYVGYMSKIVSNIFLIVVCVALWKSGNDVSEKILELKDGDSTNPNHAKDAIDVLQFVSMFCIPIYYILAILSWYFATKLV